MDPISSGRARIDALDDQIAGLIAERVAVSRQVQAARRAAGGPRVQSDREVQVVGRWRRALGRPGGRIAMELLELSRGA